MDRELTRAELDELLPLYALDALDDEELAQVARYVERDANARAEVQSLREAVSWLPMPGVRAPESVWSHIERALDAPTDTVNAPPVHLAPITQEPGSRRGVGRKVVAGLAAAAVVLALVLGVQVVRQQDRIDDLAAEMHRDPMESQAMAARAAPDAHVIPLDAMEQGGGADVVMLPDGTGYLMDHSLPALDAGSTYQLWATVGEGAQAHAVSLGVLGREPGIVPFRLAATPAAFEVTEEPAHGSTAPGSTVVLRGDVS
jgi:hypothetical protein